MAETSQIETIQHALNVFAQPGQTVELRALNVGGRRAICEVFGDLAVMSRRAAELDDQGAQGVYFTPNPLRPDLVGGTASCRKVDVIRRHWLLIDCDPLRPSKSNSSEPEKAQAWAVLCRCRGLLDGAGMVGAVVGDSGNGWHLCYPLDLPNDDDSQALVKAALKGLSVRCGDPTTKEMLEAVKVGPLSVPLAKVEEDVFDAPRIWKLYGTVARKGESTEDRPHRWAQLIEGEPWREDVAAANTQVLRQLVATWQRSEEMRRGRPETTASTYAAAALKRECDLVANAPPQGWNDQLFRSAAALAELVAAGALTRSEVEGALAEASRRRGHDDAEVGGTINSGFTHGLQQPRDLSGVNGRGSGSHSESRTRTGASESEPRRTVSADNIATIDDLIEAGACVKSHWEGWLQTGVLTALAGPAEAGKTRFCADLIRRVRHGLPWPDGQPMTLPPDSMALWVASDNNHNELVDLCVAFGIKDNVRLNAYKTDPYGGTLLDDAEDLRDLAQRIKVLRPAFVFVDTVGNSTDKNLCKQEDAKAYYTPFQILARQYSCCFVPITHLNASGHFLGRRVLEKVRVALMLSQPDKSVDKRRLEVHKTSAKKPPPLGITMGDHGAEYDTQPPTSPEEGGSAAPLPTKVREAVKWLSEHLKSGPKRVSITRTAAEMDGISSRTLYRARDYLCVEEYESENHKWWKLTSDESSEDPFVQAVQPPR